MSYLRWLCLLTDSGVEHILCCVIVCHRRVSPICLSLWIVHFLLPLWYISSVYYTQTLEQVTKHLCIAVLHIVLLCFTCIFFYVNSMNLNCVILWRYIFKVGRKFLMYKMYMNFAFVFRLCHIIGLNTVFQEIIYV